MTIKFAESEAEINECFSVVQELRPHLKFEEFYDQILRMQSQGFQMLFLKEDDSVVAVAGLRIMENLFHGKFISIDDIITSANARSKGYGKRLLDWIIEYGKANGCSHVDLDSGVQRFDAHRFYLRNRMHIAAHHFSLPLEQ